MKRYVLRDHADKTKRLPVFLGNTTTPYWCTARSVDDEISHGFLVLFLYCVYEDCINTFHRLFEIII